MIIKPTPVESLYQNSAGVWDVLRTPQLSQELAIRHAIIDGLDAAIDPNVDRLTALLPIYELLTTALQKNPRLFLYLPEGLIPHQSQYHEHDVVRRYIDTLLTVFSSLLHNYEPRANYTDGDEPDATPLISPAAVVARILVNKKLLTDNWHHWYCATSGNILYRSYVDDLETKLPDDLSSIDNPKRVEWIKREKLRRQKHATGQINYDEVPITNLEGPLSDNLFAVENEMAKIYNAVSTDMGLEFLYPVVIFFGSRFKGYGESSSDLDFAVFVREQLRVVPDIGTVEKYINNKIPRVVTFWLDRDRDKLSIHDFGNGQPSHIGMPFDAHVLFNGVWVGDDSIKQRLCDMLVKPMAQSNALIKSVYLRELERDLLQYRLLHRGYETYYPTTRPVFMDDGYRWLATKLFLKYVFLP